MVHAPGYISDPSVDGVQGSLDILNFIMYTNKQLLLIYAITQTSLLLSNSAVGSVQ